MKNNMIEIGKSKSMVDVLMETMLEGLNSNTIDNVLPQVLDSVHKCSYIVFTSTEYGIRIPNEQSVSEIIKTDAYKALIKKVITSICKKSIVFKYQDNHNYLTDIYAETDHDNRFGVSIVVQFANKIEKIERVSINTMLSAVSEYTDGTASIKLISYTPSSDEHVTLSATYFYNNYGKIDEISYMYSNMFSVLDLEMVQANIMAISKLLPSDYRYTSKNLLYPSIDNNNLYIEIKTEVVSRNDIDHPHQELNSGEGIYNYLVSRLRKANMSIHIDCELSKGNISEEVSMTKCELDRILVECFEALVIDNKRMFTINTRNGVSFKITKKKQISDMI